jgi:prolyl oligopeptidase
MATSNRVIQSLLEQVERLKIKKRLIQTASGGTDYDPHKWLEEVLGDEALAWVKTKNEQCISSLGDPSKTETFKRILGILDSKDKIPNIYRIGGEGGNFYDFWRDDKHVQGIWRKTTLESYKTGTPDWKIVIDLDALPPPKCGTAKTWVWHGSTLLDNGPGTECDRALIALSPGGSDADTSREFDLKAEAWIDAADGGFAMPEASKGSIRYRSKDEVLVGTDFEGDGSTMTDSGYPRVVKSWKRGTPIETAKVVFEGEQADVAASQYAYHDRGFVHEFQMRCITFYTSKYFYRKLTQDAIRSVTAADESTPFAPVPIPEDAELGTFANAALVTLRTDWKPPGCESTFKSGALISAPMESVMNDDWSGVTALFEPTPSKSLSSSTETRVGHDHCSWQPPLHCTLALYLCTDPFSMPSVAASFFYRPPGLRGAEGPRGRAHQARLLEV